MARNGSGTYNRAVSSYTAGTTITAATVNQEMDDIATALTGSMARDGQSPPTANIPMGGFRITGLANAVAATDAATLGQVDGRAEVDVASAGTTDIGAAASNNVRITGTTTITSFGTAASGVTRQLRFAAALTLTYNATSLILPGAANIITAAGDTATAISLGSGNWVVSQYTRQSGLGVEIIQRQTVTSVSAIDFTIPSGFTDFDVSWALIFSADAQIVLRSSVDGTTFPSGASDYQQAYIFNSGASGSNIGSSANNGILICPLADATTTGTGSFKFTSASGFRVQGATSMVLNAAGAQWEQGIAAGVRNSAALPLAFRMLPTSGTVTGTVTLRGMR